MAAMVTDPRIDAYIAKAAPFAQPILKHLRAQVHAACPEVEETVKWQSPSFTYKGKLLCGMAAFKAHCTFGFWNGALVTNGAAMPSDAMGQFGRITALDDLPPAGTMKRYMKTAMQLVDEGVTRPRAVAARKPPPRIPAALKQALGANRRAAATFEKLPPSHKRDYIEWITEAKTAPTRERRLATTLQWLEEGKHRNWKYDR
jgi:uncharacterized protein YdeI (YjbR/CyaY-like superfamily)